MDTKMLLAVLVVFVASLMTAEAYGYGGYGGGKHLYYKSVKTVKRTPFAKQKKAIFLTA